MKIVSFFGQDAIDMAVATNRQPEAFDGKAWKPILMWRAAAIASRTPEGLRLRGPARTIAEAILGQALATTPGRSLAEHVRAVHSDIAKGKPDKKPGKPDRPEGADKQINKRASSQQVVRAIALLLNELED